MSNDLISRNDVLLILEKVFKEYRISWGKSSGGFAAAVPNAIENIPTAYDIDKVVERLKQAAWALLSDDVIEHYCVDLVDAIEIVKGGAE